ncbi:MAG TPA: aminotransferase class V-fold PLP-dependent enzyme [Flavisolibacter sp.]|jgi:selenocysteine lyase/cysteine desulfurase
MNSMQSYQAINWKEITELFAHDKKYTHLGASQFIVSHPKHVHEAINKYRTQLDGDPVLYTEEVENKNMQNVREAAAGYFGVPDPNNIAVTDSTTMGLGLIYTALNLQKGQEILTTEHDHYSQHEAIYHATKRTGASFRKIPLYQNLSEVTKEEMVDSLVRNIHDNTRVVGVTWVHSSSGLKIPVPEIAAAIKKVNEGRDEQNKVLLLVDGVHGFGIERETFDELGCDFFISGCHKWIYGPRGTGIVVATRSAWQTVSPVIPSFTEVMDKVIAGEERPKEMDGKQMTPGGFHSLEYRWALCEAFEWMMGLGKKEVYQRVHELNRKCKEGLATMSHVTLHTPMDDELSSGIISFEIKGLSTEEAVEELNKRKIIGTASPYKTSWVRFTPGIINMEEDIAKALEVVNALKQ